MWAIDQAQPSVCRLLLLFGLRAYLHTLRQGDLAIAGQVDPDLYEAAAGDRGVQVALVSRVQPGLLQTLEAK